MDWEGAGMGKAKYGAACTWAAGLQSLGGGSQAQLQGEERRSKAD